MNTVNLTNERMMKLQKIIAYWNENRVSGEVSYNEDTAIGTLLSLKIDEEYEKVISLTEKNS